MQKLADRLLDRVRAFVRYLVTEDADADDLAQNAMLEILQSASTFQGRSRLERWADIITYRTVMAGLRERHRSKRVNEFKLELAATGVAGSDRTSISSDTRDLRRRLARLLHRLSGPKRTAVVLKHVLGYTLREMSAITGAPLNTVRDRLQVGRQELRELILKDPNLQNWMEWVKS